MQSNVNCVVLLGPTAVGKTSLGVSLAKHFGWDIISADSRQVYKGLDLGSGKDLAEYDGVPHHLIDVTTLDSEYNVFHFQQDFYNIFNSLSSNGKLSFVVGGTGMYVDSVVRGYDFVPVPENPQLRSELESKTIEELGKMLLELRPDLHNKSDIVQRDRATRAIEIALFMKSEECRELRETLPKRPEIKPLVIGTTISRDDLHKNIEKRLFERIEDGMIDEVKNLHDINGYSWERLEKLGLEYRFVSLYLEGKIQDRSEMVNQLYHAICQFAKRQETWFRGMERKGVGIHWITSVNSKHEKYDDALKLIEQHL